MIGAEVVMAAQIGVGAGILLGGGFVALMAWRAARKTASKSIASVIASSDTSTVMRLPIDPTLLVFTYAHFLKPEQRVQLREKIQDTLGLPGVKVLILEGGVTLTAYQQAARNIPDIPQPSPGML